MTEKEQIENQKRRKRLPKKVLLHILRGIGILLMGAISQGRHGVNCRSN